MQGQGTQVLRLLAGAFDYDAARRNIGIGSNADGGCQMILGRKPFGQAKRLFGDREVLNPIQCIDFDLRIIHGGPIYIPAPFVALHEIGPQLDMLGLFQIERVVLDLQHAQFPDGFENRFQITQGRRYVFDENSVSDAFILQNHIAGRKTVEQPLGEIVLNQFGFVFDIIFVGGLVAGDTYVEELFDGFAVLVEGPQRNGLAFGQVVKQPPAVDFGKGDASGTIDRIGQPDISVEEIG